jgi:hypothetical protein
MAAFFPAVLPCSYPSAAFPIIDLELLPSLLLEDDCSGMLDPCDGVKT